MGVTKSPIVVNIWFVNEQNCVNLPIPLFRDDIILLFYRPDSIPVFVVYGKELGLNTPTFLVDQKNPKAGHLKHSYSHLLCPFLSLNLSERFNFSHSVARQDSLLCCGG